MGIRHCPAVVLCSLELVQWGLGAQRGLGLWVMVYMLGVVHLMAP